MSAACGGGSAPAQGAGAPPPTAVKTSTLAPTAIEDASEFIATLRSLRSTTIQPEVEGLVTRILVKSGQRVSVGTPLVQINPAKQQAAVSSAEANRAGTEADVQVLAPAGQALESLVEAGAVSKAEFDQAQNSLRTAEARLAALDAQVREGRVELEFYRVVAPQAGTVGDIAVRVGDRVTNSTTITTIDDGQALEAYIQIPLDRSPQLRLGLPVQLMDADGKVIATNPISFVASRVDDGTQTVLVKSLLRDVPPSVRVLQFIRSRIVWRSVQGLTMPLTSVVRISGQVLLLRGRTRCAGRPGREAEADRSRPVDRQRLRRAQRAQSGRDADRLRHSEDRRRRAGESRIEMLNAELRNAELGMLNWEC